MKALLPLFLLLPAVALAAPVNVALNQPVRVDSILSPGYPGENAVDGNSSSDVSRWISSGDSYPHWIEIDLQQSYQVSGLRFWTGKNGIGPFPLYDFALQSWNGNGWTDLYSEVNSTNAGFVDVTFGPMLSGNRVRFLVTAGEDSRVRLFEIEVLAEPHDLGYTATFPSGGGTLFDPAADLTVSFDAPVSAGTLSGIRIEDLDTGTDLPGVSAAVNGSDLEIQHGGLATNGNYAVHVPEGVVVLASDGSTPNGPLYWEFTTAPLKPQVVSHSSEVPGLTGDVEVVFDRDIGLLNPSGIQLERFSDGVPVGGINITASGASLVLEHDPLVARQAYVLSIPAGSLEGLVNSEGNEALRLAVYGGSSTLIETDFDTGLEGFNTAHNLGETTGTSSNIYWKWTNSGIGPDFDSAYLRSDTNYSDDFVVSPLIDLNAGNTYILEFRADLNRPLHVGLTSSATLQDVELLDTISGGGPKNVRLEFTADSSGPQYLIFFSGDTMLWQDQAIDAFLLTESIPPVVRIHTPLEGSSHLESAVIPVQIEAFGLAGELTSVEIFDNGSSRGLLSPVAGFYTYDWAYHGPGEHILRVEATDSRGNVSVDEVTVTITFDDGTLPRFMGWDFDGGKEGWRFFRDGSEVLSGSALRLLSSQERQPGSEIVFNNKGSNGLAISSPVVFLLAGETYTLQFDARFDASGPAWGFLPTAVAGYPADTTGSTAINLIEDSWERYSYSFTVPADGSYHLTIFAPLSGYWGARIDDIRLIGNFNTSPIVDLLVPETDLTTFAGATIPLLADASDSDGSVASVEFTDVSTSQLLDPAAVVTSSPWGYDWLANIPGRYEIAARATDDAQGTTVSASRTVDVAPNNLSISTYLGGTDTNESFTGAVYLSDGTLVLGGILDPALFPGVTPLYLNGSTPGDRGVVARLSGDGTQVLGVTVVGAQVTDLDTDDSDRIFVAAMGDGAVVLNAGADTVLWSADYSPAHAHRVDAADGGTFAVLTSSQANYLDSRVHTGSNYIYDTNYTLLGTTGGSPQYTLDLAVDETSQTVVFIGYKNIFTSGNPVDIPSIVGRGYDNSIKWHAYDWGGESEGTSWLNYYTNNMADTRGARVIIHGGKVYAGIEFDGGNTPLRYDPFDLAVPASVVGGDQYHFMANTSTVPKTFIGIYDAATGSYYTGQWITNRLPNGNDNTIRIEHGNLLVDDAGRIHVVGSSAAGLPMTHDPFPGAYSGGGYHLVYSPDFESREFMTRLSIKGSSKAVALSPDGRIAIAGSTELDLFTVNPLQATRTNSDDAWFAVGDYEGYYNFQSGEHPRLFFDSSELIDIRDRLGEEPYASMYAELLAKRDFGNFYRPYDPGDPRALFSRAQGSAFLYALSGDEAFAQDARDDLETAYNLIGSDWASASTKGLELYSYATELAMAYDLCAGSAAWDAAFNFDASKRLLQLAEVIVNDGGREQPSSLGSNWRGARGSSAGLALLATDHVYDPSLASSADGMVQNYLNTNQGPNNSGWNPEGFGYTAYAIGNFVGPYGIAYDQATATSTYRNDGRMEGLAWSGFAGATTAYNVYGLGGVKTDWSDDNAHIGGEGIYGQAFYYANASMVPAFKYSYDRLMGALSPFAPLWDSVQQGAFWSILYYPADTVPQSPLEVWGWHSRSDDSSGLGVFTFRNAYQDGDDILSQFKAKLYTLGQAHDGPDGLGFRLIGCGDAFVVGGGRNSPGSELNQATVYPADPDVDFAWNKNLGTLEGTPLVKADGGGHVIARMGLNNVGTSNHKRWYVTDFDSSATGADAVIVVADTTNNGLYWQIPTFLNNTVTTSGNTFTITGTKGATLKGTILHPGGTPVITVGTKERGSGYTLTNGGTLATEDPVSNPRIEENRYLYIHGSGDGDFLVVMTLVKTGGHPAVTRIAGGVADAVIQVGSRQYSLLADDVLYDGGSYVAPDAVVTFDADGKGVLGGAAVQNVPYGGSAVAPVVSPDSGYTFVGWDKTFNRVVRSMTVTALYEAAGGTFFASWIADPAYGLDPDKQGPDDDPDFDGIPSIVEFVLKLNPSIADGAGAITMRMEGGDLVLGYRIRDSITGVTVQPRFASALSGPWSDVPAGNISPVGSGPGYTEYEARMPVGGTAVFLLLEVTLD